MLQNRLQLVISILELVEQLALMYELQKLVQAQHHQIIVLAILVVNLLVTFKTSIAQIASTVKKRIAIKVNRGKRQVLINKGIKIGVIRIKQVIRHRLQPLHHTIEHQVRMKVIQLAMKLI